MSEKAKIGQAGKSNYHHGDLATTIMELAIEEIAQQGTERLSLRLLARQAGVSQTAPYRHFPTKTCLLAALATRGFVELRERVRSIVESDAPIETRFIGMGVSYVEFALENPVLYQLMFGGVVADFSAYESLQTAAKACYMEVRRCEQELIAAKRIPHEDVRLGGAIWAGVHGIASLLLNMQPGPEVGRERNDPRSAVQAMRADVEDTVRILFGRMVE
ncbi:MAG: TetR/AcrR family transcriptional regulator [Pseudomonadota bacterium]